MQQLYKQILETNKSQGCVPVDLIVSGSGKMKEVKQILANQGYSLQGLTDRQISILFVALVDILYIVDKDSFYLVTLCKEKILELYKLMRIVKRDDEHAFERTYQILESNTVPVINKFLAQGKFHFIKLNDIANCRNTIFLCRLGTMSPYPTLSNGEVVYAMANVSAWHNACVEMLIKGLCKINNEHICQNYMARSKSLCTTGNLVTKNQNNEVISFRIWDVKDIKPYSENELVTNLLSGICLYDDAKITLNRTVLEKYYGAVLYKKLESEGVRQRYCLEELLSPGSPVNVPYYLHKYNLKINADDILDLEVKLERLVPLEPERTDIIHARVLDSAGVFLNEHKSFYKTINLNNVKNHVVEVVQDISTILPKTYKFSAISTHCGYQSCKIDAHSVDLALKYGKTEFERQFGDCIKFCSLSCDSKIEKGNLEFTLPLANQQQICQLVMWGYVDFFADYYKEIVKVCELNKISWISEDHVKYLLINKLALKFKQPSNIKLGDCSSYLYDFMVLASDQAKLKKALDDERIKITYHKAKKEYESISSKLPDLTGYVVDDTNEGKFIVTENAKFKLIGDRLSKNIQLYYEGTYIGTKQFKEG